MTASVGVSHTCASGTPCEDEPKKRKRSHVLFVPSLSWCCDVSSATALFAISMGNFHRTAHHQVTDARGVTHSQTLNTHTCRLKIAAALPFCTLSCWETHPLPRWSPAHHCWSVPWSSTWICHRKCQVILLWTEWTFWCVSKKKTMPEHDVPLP